MNANHSLYSRVARGAERMNYVPRLMYNLRFGEVKNVAAEGGRRAQLPAHVHGHLSTDHMGVTHARMRGCQEKAASVSQKPLVLSFKLI